jgi:biopolymer transport protein ExbB/TolQ
MLKNMVPYLILAVFLVVTIYYVLEIFRLRSEATRKYQDVEWNLRQLSRALDLIRSDDENEIFTGLEILYALNHPSRLRALPRLAELAANSNPRIARQARKIIEAVGHSADRAQKSDEAHLKTA